MPNQNMINREWVFGHRARLVFSTSPPTALAGSAISTAEGCASICDATGQLLLYSDGQNVWDGSHTLRVSGLQGNPSSTQSAIIIPDPGNGQRYYVFTADGNTGGNQHFNGRRIDVSNWAATAPLSSLMTMPSVAGLSPTEKLTAVQHANCVDYWVLTILQGPGVALDAGNGPGIIRAFLVNAAGVQHVGDTPLGVNVNDVGYLKASPNGRRLAVANYTNMNVLLYNFNNSTGVVSGLVTIPAPALSPAVPNHPRAPYGVEFSPNSNVLYYSILGNWMAGNTPTNNGYIFQVDLTVPPVSTQIVAYPNVGAGYALGALQLGIDGRIYVAKPGEANLGAILNPNVVGMGCGPNVSPPFVNLAPGTVCNLGLPNLLPNACDCACEENCEEEVEEANQTLGGRADHKQFTINANGQTLPATCNLAFESAAFAPVFTLKWGDGPSDQFESDDLEVIYIRAHNPYRNLVYRNLAIFNIRVTPNQTLPDGDDALRIIPAEIACFDEVPPCSYVARDFALIIDHALVGTYHISFDYCIGELAVVGGTEGGASFDIKVVAS